jgi:hypothetical protein
MCLPKHVRRIFFNSIERLRGIVVNIKNIAPKAIQYYYNNLGVDPTSVRNRSRS